MSRSVSTPSEASDVAYATFECDCEDDASYLFQDAIDNLRALAIKKYPSLSEADRWIGRENHVAMTPIAALEGQHSLEVSSQWLGSANPNALVRQLQITLPTVDVHKLHQALGSYLETQSCAA